MGFHHFDTSRPLVDEDIKGCTECNVPLSYDYCFLKPNRNIITPLAK